MRDNTSQWRELFVADVPLLDVRAPVEFAKGAFPGSENQPLMNDPERQKIGTCYKQHGQQAAIELGHRLVSGPVKDARIAAWADFARRHPEGYLYCFRGGLRSQITQQWLEAEAGIAYPRVIGGYKALRTTLMNVVDEAVAECDFVLVGGLTGCGKTEVLAQLDNAIDLEGHANHRGSSFGRRATAQPPQIGFENAVAIDLLKKRARGVNGFVLEDEGRVIGSRDVALPLHRRMQESPLVWLEDSVEQRIERILRDYVIELCAEFVAVEGAEAGFDAFATRLRGSLANNVRRLGGERYQRLAAIMDEALARQRRDGSVDLHRAWIEGLLREYYDPMYAYQRESKMARVEFSGERQAVVEYLRQRGALAAGRLSSNIK